VTAATHHAKRKKAVHRIAISVFVYGTEDENKVCAALRLIVPEHIPVNRQHALGHFGNAITILKARVTDRQTIVSVIETIMNKLPKSELHDFRAHIQLHISEKCALEMKFDKQLAARGILAFGKDDPIVARIKIAAYPARPETAAEIVRDFLNNARIC
jgi:RNA binding exosome subunit